MNSTTDKTLIARCAIRVSDTTGRGKGTGRELYSPEMQLAEARELCRMNCWTLDEKASLAHQDIDQSGFRKRWTKRPGITKHLADAQASLYDVIIFYKISRIGRKMREGLEIWDAFKSCQNGKFIIGIAKERIDDSTATGRFTRNMLLAMSEMESENTSQFVSDSLYQRALSGKVHGRCPAWVHKNPETGELYISDEDYATIRRLYELRMTPLSYTAIARKLNAEGFTMPLEERLIKKDPNRERMRWTWGNVQHYCEERRVILQMGHSQYGGKLDKGDPRRLLQRDVRPAVLTEEEGNALLALEARLKEKPLPNRPASIEEGNPLKWWHSQPNRRAASTSYLLTGLAYCHLCGSRLRGGTSSKDRGNGPETINRYHCPNALALADVHSPRQTRVSDGVARKGGGPGHSFTAVMTERAVLTILSAVAKRVLVPAPVKKASKEEQSRERRAKTAKERLKQETERIQREVSSIVKLHGRGILSDADFDTEYTRLQSERAELELEAAPAEAVSTKSLLAALSSTPEGEYSQESLREVLRLAVGRIEMPITIEGKYQRPELKPDHPANNLARYVRVYLKPGILPDVAYVQVQLRNMKWSRPLPEAEFVEKASL